MKRLLFTSICGIMIHAVGFAQNTFPSSGNAGIGTATPIFPLQLIKVTNPASGFNAGAVISSEQTGATTGNVTGVAAIGKISHTSGTVTLGVGLSGSMEVTGSGTTTGVVPVGSGGFASGTASVGTWACFSAGFSLFNSATVTNAYGLIVNTFPASGVTNKWGVYVTDATCQNYFAGKVGIGTNAPGSFQLAVEGNIGAREVEVLSTSPFPDYVFNKDYPLMSIGALDKYIQANRHLPNMPTANDIAKRGSIPLSDLNTRLLEKVEELTLYIIELQKQVNKLTAAQAK